MFSSSSIISGKLRYISLVDFWARSLSRHPTLIETLFSGPLDESYSELHELDESFVVPGSRRASMFLLAS